MPNFSIGVDLGGTNLRIAAVNQQGDFDGKSHGGHSSKLR